MPVLTIEKTIGQLELFPPKHSTILSLRVLEIVDYLFKNNKIECEAIAYNQILFDSERDLTAAALIISSFDDIKIV